MTIIPYPVTPNTIYNWDASTLARTMRGCGFKANCVVTSPPYYGLRDYGADGQIGLEATPDEYVAALVGLFREIKHVLSDDGTVWLNLGDTYSNAGKWGGNKGYDTKQASNVGSIRRTVRNARDIGAKPKDLLLIPSRVAIALQDDGWYVRAEIIWAKPNAMPESVQDRPTKSHEQVYLLTKSERYYYDAEAIRDESAPSSQARARYNGKQTAQPKATQGVVDGVYCGVPSMAKAYGQGRNKRSVWTIPTQPYSGAHFATFPPKLIEPMILAGCPETVCAVCGKPHVRDVERTVERYNEHEGVAQRLRNAGASTGGWERVTLGVTNGVKRKTLGFAPTCTCNADTRPGVVFDPFMGAGTTALVARQHGRDYVGSEINPQYVAIAQERLRLPFEQHYVEKPTAALSDLPMFAGIGDVS